jgi:hypothetical protein
MMGAKTLDGGSHHVFEQFQFRIAQRLLAAVCGAAVVTAASAACAQVRDDEEVLCFPTAAVLSEDGTDWIVPIHGWIFERELGLGARSLLVAQVRVQLDLDLDDDQKSRFEQRTRWFLVDNERGKMLQIEFAGQTFDLQNSGDDGHFAGTVQVPREILSELATDDRVTYRIVLPDGDDRVFEGVVHLTGPAGLTIISDVDDTVKISEVTDRQKLLRNTFVEPFDAVEGMATIYQRWTAAGAQLHFVSASPWQLYSPLGEFLEEAGFPSAVWHMRSIRLKDLTVLRLFDDPFEAKLAVIDAILISTPQRQFVLVGDSGEQDPEVYGEIARRHPDQVLGVLIRHVTEESGDESRFADAFEDVPRERWQLFATPADIDDRFLRLGLESAR